MDISDTDSYVFDVFRARGGQNHRLSFNGPSQTAQISGIKLRSQETGTFAGPDIEFAAFAVRSGNSTTLSSLQEAIRRSGFSYLFDVERSTGPVDSYYTVDWKGEDLRGRIKEGKEPHLRLHALTPCDEVALASGEPPQNRPNAMRSLRYLIQSKLGMNMQSQFVTVLEPYEKTPFIKQVRRLDVEHDADVNSVAAVAVEMVDGTTDILVSCEEPTEVTVEGSIEFNGQFGMVRLVDGEVKLMRMNNARLLRRGEVAIATETPAYTGKVTGIDATDAENNLVFLDPPLPADTDLIGKPIMFKNDLPLDTTYDIKAVTAAGISTGDITIIQGFKDPADFSAGHNYLVNVGDEYVVHCQAGLDR